jgi:hypothetical protein
MASIDSVGPLNDSATSQSKAMVFRLTAGLVALLSAAAPLSAQSQGNWAGPYDVAPIDCWDGQTYCTGEIVHLAILPPSVIPGSSPPASALDNRVFLSCVPGSYITADTDCTWETNPELCPAVEYTCASSPSPHLTGSELASGMHMFGRTFLWYPGNVTRVTQIPIPTTYPEDGSEDFMCGGHTFLRDGSFLFCNGVAPKLTCENGWGLTGNSAAWKLDTSTAIPTWTTATSSGAPLPRFYPTVLTMNTGDALLLGHSEYPFQSPYQSTLRDEFNPSTSAWSTTANATTAQCAHPPVLWMGGYPRVHLLASGQLVWTTSYTYTSNPDTWAPLDSQFLKLVTPFPACGEPRWKDGPNALPQHLHLDGNSVHLITYNYTTQAFTEVIYVIGGSAKEVNGVSDNGCVSVMNSGINGFVEKMVLDPAPTGDVSDTAFWTSAPPLNSPRGNCNAVILLDGSILIVGGMSYNGACVWQTTAERYMPPEVLDVPPSTDPGWQVLAAATTPRQYHSVAGLLPDGRVISAGGRNLPTLENNWCKPDHTLEVFSPPYALRGGTPVIDRATLKDPAAESYGYNTLMQDIKVTLASASGVSVDRLVLIHNGCSTHAFDTNQLYVELKITNDVAQGGNNAVRILRAVAPLNGYWAPPGYYLLVAVDNLGRPSSGEWIRIG